MNNNKEKHETDAAYAYSQYASLDPVSQCITTTILQLAATLLVGIQQVQQINGTQKENADNI